MSPNEPVVEWALKGSMDVASPRKQVRIGPCDILSQLATGNSGAVFKAYHTERAEIVAVKILPRRRMTPVDTDRFKRDLARYTQLSHPHLVKILGGGIDHGRCYLVLELIEGGHLGRLLDQEGPMAPGRVVSHMEGVLDALAYLHRNRIVHRGIKPSSLMIDHRGQVKLGSVGPTWLDDLPLYERIELAAESLMYVALEDTTERPEAADMFVLGLVLHRMLVGSLPHGATSIGELVDRMGSADPRPLGELRAGIPDALQDLVADLLQGDASGRPTAVEALMRWREIGTGGAANREPGSRRGIAAVAGTRVSGGTPRISVRGNILVSQASIQETCTSPSKSNPVVRFPSLLERIRSSFQHLAQRVAGEAIVS